MKIEISLSSKLWPNLVSLL